MRGWLLDTNVISELSKPRASAAVVDFITAQPGDVLYVSDITLGEIRYGIEQLDEPTRRADLSLFLDRTIRPLFVGRTLPISEDVIVRWKTMVVEGQKRGHTFGQPDLFIAAIAALDDLVVVSRDISNFVEAGVPVFDPWAGKIHTERGPRAIAAPATVEKAIRALGR